MKSGFKKTLMAAAIATVVSQANATMYDVYNPDGGYAGDGSELAAALVTPGSGITIVNNSSQFQGNFGDSGFGDYGGDYGGEFGDDGGPVLLNNFNTEFPFDDDIPFEDEPFGDPSAGSAAFFSDLDFGTAGGHDFVLPNGILLTSGNADLNHNANLEGGFTGNASGLGDVGLQNLLDTFGEAGGEGGEGHTSEDATVLAFDFTVDAGIEAVSLDFLFGSEEFSEYVDSYPEIAGIFIDGVNFAVLPDGSPLTFTDQTVGAGNFFNNDPHDNPDDGMGGLIEPLDVEYDGVTRPLSLVGLLDTDLDVHSIKIAVSDTNDSILDTGLFVANLQGLPGVPGIDPTDPIMPIDPTDPTFTFTIDVGDSGVGIDPLFPIFIDPELAIGYTYTVTGSTFGSVVLPSFAFGDNLYDILGYNTMTMTYDLLATDWAAGDTFLFTSGYSQFQVLGIEAEAMVEALDPTAFVTGLTFTSGGSLTVTQTAVTNVPAPAPITLVLVGLAGMYISRKKKKAH